LHRFSDIEGYRSKIAKKLHLYLAPPFGVTPLELRRDLWRQKNRSLINFNALFARFYV